MPSASAAGPAARPRNAFRALLLSGTAGVAMLSAADGAGASNILPTQGAINLTTAGAGKLATKVLSGGGVAAGSINYTSKGTSATLTLPSQRTLIDWTTFGVGSTNSLTFDFTSSASAVVLNRVPVGASIMIDKGGTVSGQFHGATGGNIWFLADGGVFIHGKVTASGVLATNNSFGLADLDLLNDNIGALKTNLAAASGLIDLSGIVVASGVEVDAKTGNVVLTGELDASAAGASSAGAINIATTGAVALSGVLDASSKSGVGGAITVTGQSVTLAGASLDASGVLGGGTIRVGGDARGGGTLAQASATSIDAASTIGADATMRGDGGSVVVWSTEKTEFAGQISARGAGAGGQGGAAEVSSHNLLAYTGFTNLTAPSGRTGVLLLDPTNLTIAGTTTTGVTTTGTAPAPVTDSASASPSVLQNTTLNTQLAGANVTVTTVGSPDSPGEHGDITVSAPVTWSTANSLTLNAAGLIAINATITGSSVSSALALNSAGPITQTAAITVGTLTGSSAGGATFNNTSNAIRTFGPFSDASSGNVTLVDGRALAVTGVVSLGTGTLTLTSTGAISGDGATITAGTLTGSSVGGASFNDASNAIATFQGFTNTTSGDVVLADGVNLSANTIANTVGSVNLSSTGSLSITGTALAPGADLTLTAGTALTQANAPTVVGSYSITGTSFDANSLTPTFSPGVDFTVDALASLTLTTDLTATHNLKVSSTGTLDTTGATLTATGGTLTLQGATGLSVGATVATAGSSAFSTTTSGNISLQGAVNAFGQTLTLTSAGTTSQTATGVIKASTLTGSSVGGATLGDTTNQIGTFGGFTDSADGSVDVADSLALTVTGVVSVGTGTLTLTSTGTISGNGATITAGTLTGSSVGGATFNNTSNAIGTFGPFSDSSDGNVTLADGEALTVAGAVSVGTGTLTLASADAISGTGATITAGTLTGSSVGGATFGNASNAIGTLGPFSDSSGGNVTVADGEALTVTGAVSIGTGILTLTSTAAISGNGATITAGTLTGSSAGGATFNNTSNAIRTLGPFSDASSGNVTLVDGRALAVTGVVSLGTGTLTLTSTGAISGDGATITAGTLTGSSVGGASFNDASNAIATFQGFTNTTSGDVVLADGVNLSANTIANTVGSVNLSSTGSLSITGTALAPGADLTLTAGTALTQANAPTVVGSYSITGTSFDANSLTPTFSPGVDFTVDALASLTLTTDLTATHNLKVSSTGTLDTTGATLTATGGTLTLQGATGLSVGATVATAGSSAFSTTTSGNISLQGTVNATGQSLTLTSAGTIAANSATITASTLTGSSVGGASFNNTSNAIATLGPFSDSADGNVTLVDGRALAVTGVVSLGTGTLTLTSTGAISGDGATITAGTLTGSSVGGASFNDASNAIATFQGFTNTTSGDVVLADGVNLSANTIANTVGSVNLSSTGSLSITGTALAPGVDLILAAGTSLDLAASPIVVRDYVVTAQTFLGESLNPTFNPGRNFIEHDLSTTTLTLTSDITVPGALTITSAGLLDTSGVTLTSTAGALTLTGGVGLDIGATVATAGPTTFTTTAGPITLSGSVNAGGNTLTINSASLVNQTGGSITAGTLTGSSAGGASFGSASNAIATLGPFGDTANGNVTLADGRALTVAGAVSLGTGTLTLTSTGTISADGATITAGTLSGSSAGGASFDDAANAIGTFQSFTNTVSGDIVLVDGVNLTANTIADSVGSLNLSSTGLLHVTGPALDPGVDLTLSAGTGLTQVNAPTVVGDYSITAASFDTNSLSPAFTPGRDFTVDALASFTLATDLTATRNLKVISTGTLDTTAATLTATHGTLTLQGATGLDVGATVASSGSSMFSTTTSGTISLQGPVNATGQTLTVVSAGTIAANGAAITAATLTGSSAGGASFGNASNAIGTFGPFNDTANGAVRVADSENLTVTGAVSLGTGRLTLVSAGVLSGNGATITAGTLTGSSAGGASFDNASNAIGTFGPFDDASNGNVTLADGRNLTVAGAVSLGTGTLTLTSAGTIAGNGATITAGTLTGSSVGGASFGNTSNAIATFGSFSNTGGGAVTVADGEALTVTGAVSIGTGTLTLVSTGAISGNGATITAGALAGSSAGGASFDNTSNAIGTFGPFSDTAGGNVIVTDGEALTVTGAVSIGTGTLTLTSITGAISGNGATITAGTLTGSSAGGASFGNASNAIGTFGSFNDTANGAVTVADGEALTVAGVVSLGTGTLTLTSAGTISASGATITAGTLTGSSVGGASFNDTANAIATFGPFSDTANGNVALADGRDLTVTGAVSLGTGTFTLTSAGTIAADSATITAGTLTGSSTGGASFTDASNAIATFGPFADTANGNVVLADSRALTVTGAVSVGAGTLTLTSTGSIAANGAAITAATLTGSSVGGASFNDASNAIGAFGAFSNTGGGNVVVADGENLTVTGAVSLGAGTLTLTSAGTIAADSATITAGTLTGSSVGGASFTDASNAIATFGPFADTANGNVVLADSRALTVTGAVSVGAGTLTLTSTGSIAANGAAITAATLTGSSVGGASFNDASNAIGAFGAFSNTGGGNVVVADGENLTVTGAVSLGAGTLTLTSTGVISANGATITAGTLTGSSVGGASFNDASNAIATFGPFADTANGDVVLSDGRALTVTGAVSNGTGVLTLTSTGAISGNGATITTGTLTGSSVGGASFDNASNAIATFGAFSDTSNGNVTVADGQNLIVTGAISIGTGTLTLASAGTIAADGATLAVGTLAGSSVGGASFNNASNAIGTFGPFADTGAGNVTLANGQNLVVTGTVSLGTGTLTLTSAGTIAADTATITAGTLTGSSVGGASFNDTSNAIATFGPFADTAGGNVTLGDGRNLTVTGAVNVGTGTLTLISTGSIGGNGATITAATLAGSSVGGASFNDASNAIGAFGPFADTRNGAVTLADGQNLVVTGAVSLGTGTLTLTSAGTIVADTATITAGTLTGSSVGGASFNDASNAIATFGAFSDTAGGNVTLADGRALTVTGAVSDGTGVLTLTSIGVISANAATITTGTLTGSSVGGASFNDASNAIGTFGPFADAENGAVTLADGQSLTVAGAVSLGTGTLTLASAGTIVADTATITAGTLTGSSVGGASFNDASNAITTFGAFTDTANGNVTLADGRALTVTGAVSNGAGVLTLTSTGVISANGATITTGTLTGSSVGGASFDDVSNAIGTFGPFADTAGGNVTLADGQNLTVTGTVSLGAGTLTVTSTGTIAADSATITAGTLKGSSVGGASFNDASNAITTFGPFADTANGNVTLADGQSLTVTGAVSLGTGTLTLTSAGTLSANSATLTVGTLTGSSVGGASFDDAANAIGTFGPFSDTANGSVTLADGRALTVTGAVNIGTGTLTLTSVASIAADTATITTGTLTGSSVGGASFNNASNAVGTFGPYRDTANGDVTLADGRALTVAGAVNIGTGTLTLTTAGSIGGNGATIIAGALTGSSVGGASFGGPNLFASLAGFTNVGGGAVAITVARAGGLTVTGAVDAGAGDTLTLTTTNGGPLTLAANLTAMGGTVDLVSAGALDQTAGVITAATLTGSAVGAVSLGDANQLANLGGFTSAGTGDFAFTDAAASGLTVTADIAVGAGRTVTLTTTGGPLTLGADITASGGLVMLASSGVIDQTAGVITAGTLTGASVGGASLADGNMAQTLSGFVNRDSGAITLVNNAALAVTGTVDNTAGIAGGGGRDISVTLSSGSLMGPGVFTAARDVALHAGAGSLSFASATAGDDLVLRAATGVTVTGALAATGSASPGEIADPSGAGKVLAAGLPISLFGQTYATLADGSHVDVQTAGGNITLGGAVSASGDVRLQALAGAIHSSDIAAGRTIILDASTTVDHSGAPSNNLSAGVDVAVQAGSGPINVGAVVATGGDVVARSVAGAVTLASASAGDTLVLRAATAVTVQGGLASGTGSDGMSLANAFLTSQPGQALTAFGHTYASLAGGTPIDIVASTVSVGGPMTANGSGSDVRVVATGVDVGTTAALTLQGAISAGQDVALDATGGDFSRSVNGSIVVGGAIAAGRDVAARATSGSITLVSASAGDDVVLVAPGGSVNLDGSVTATGGATQGIGETLFETVNSVLDGLFTLGAQSIYVDAISFANAGYGGDHPASLAATRGVGMSLADSTGLVLADAKPAAGSWVMASTLAAPTVSLFESKGNIIVGGATVNSPVTKVNLYTSDLVMVTGLLAPATDNTANVTVGDPVQAIWTPSQIDIVNDGGTGPNTGAIGFTSVTGGVYSTTPRTFSTVSLYAVNDILLGTQAFITANAAVTDLGQIKQIDPSRPVPIANPNMSQAVMLAAGDLTLASGSLIVQQNTSGLRTTNGSGYYVTRTLTLGAYGPFPPAIDLFGVFVKPGTTTPITGPAAADVTQIFLMPNLVGSPFRGLYRVNSCIIGELGNCTPTSDGIINIPLDELSKGSLLSRDELDVEDPTITGAPNEEIWRQPDDNK